MTWIRRLPAACAGLALNAATGVAAWALLALAGVCAVVSPLPGAAAARPWALGLVHRLARFHHAAAAGQPGRELSWLALHAVAGPSSLLLVALTVMSVGQIMNLRPLDNSRAQSVTLSLAMLAILAVALALVLVLQSTQTRLARVLLRPGRVRQLTESRAAVVDAQAAELRRIERDLHDGAQARLIAVRINLGLIKGADDPEQVRALAGRAWEDTGQALADLRDLVRGIHPPVLADRGLTGAVRAAALLCPIPVEVDIELASRPQAPVESALYFAAAEALTNVAKHSGATRAWVRARHAGGVLRLTVGDDGRGGADPAKGTGLSGISRRLSAFDGTLSVHSPPGGPSTLTMELPCALS
ncbi:histidine kinase [Nonomuraea sp. NBC_01738]|uniref:sensor histidine kinase n=1 Tax=Nonomuraea sp. NBC_01738 TaxID=2976003 RepID=UPI002E0F36F2|nr:histidine kinase [Nonomuraea sp. NBC_01738]